jgi:hypothetical protein
MSARTIKHDVALDHVAPRLELRPKARLLLPQPNLARQVEGHERGLRLVTRRAVDAPAGRQRRVAAVRVAPRRDGRRADPREFIVRE